MHKLIREPESYGRRSIRLIFALFDRKTGAIRSPGFEAQRKSVADFTRGDRWRQVAELIEVESGANNARPKLGEALALCRSHRATLLVAKLDRLARDAHFLLGLAKEGVDFVAVDMPAANRMTVGIMALVAEEERRMISARTKAALGAAKARGVKLGGFPWSSGTAKETALARAARSRLADRRAASIAETIARLDPDGTG